MKKSAVVLFFAVVFFVALPSFLRPLYQPPILMYHRIGYAKDNPSLYVTPETFERQMEFLKAHRYRVWSLESLVQKIGSGDKIPMNVVVITFDDGYLDNFKNAYPVLKKMDFPATIFMITDNIGKEEWLAEEDLRILDGSEITIGSHTVHHAFLPSLSPIEAQKEIVDSKKRLESVLGHEVTLFSYPAGGTSSSISKMVEEAHYQGAVTTNYGKNNLDMYALHRIKVSEARGNLFNFWFKVSGFYHLGKRHVEAKTEGIEYAE